MFKNVVRILTLSAVALGGLVISASAQNPATTQKTQVGFDFYVGEKLMPAGEYVIRTISHNTAHGVVMIEQTNGSAKIAAHTFPVQNQEKLKAGSMQFKKYGDKHYLSSFQLSNESYMHQILKNTDARISKRETAKKVAKVADAKTITTSPAE